MTENNNELDLILRAVCHVLGKDHATIKEKGREWEYIDTRALFVYISYKLDVDVMEDGIQERWSFRKLAKFLGKKSHVSIMKSLARAEYAMTKNSRMKYQVRDICNELHRPDMLYIFEKEINHDYGQKESKNVFGIKYYQDNDDIN